MYHCLALMLINRRSLQTLQREQAAIVISTKMRNGSPETEMNCYGLMASAERPGAFCPLARMLQRYYRTSKPHVGTKPEQLAMPAPCSVPARMSLSLRGCLSCTAIATMTPAQQGEPLLRPPLASGEKSQTAVHAKKTNPLEKKLI